MLFIAELSEKKDLISESVLFVATWPADYR